MDMPHNLIEVDDRVEEINIENISNTEKEDKKQSTMRQLSFMSLDINRNKSHLI